MKADKLQLTDLFGVLFATVGACVVRAYFLDQPMRYDESWTYLLYVNQSWLAVFNYSAPNNHVLNSILIKIFTTIWGGHPEVIRLPAFIFGIAAVPLGYVLGKKLNGFGYFAALVLAIFPYLILFSTNARGYAGLVFFTLLFLIVGYEYTQKKNKRMLFYLALISALGTLNLPIMIYPVFCGTLWVVYLLKNSKYKNTEIIKFYIFPFSTYYLALTAIFYLPVLYSTIVLNVGYANAIQLIFNNDYIQLQKDGDFYHSAKYHLLYSALALLRGIPTSVVLLLCALTLIGLWADILKKRFVLVALAASVFLGLAGIFLVGQNIPYVRTWIFIIPIIVLLADRGFIYILGLITPIAQKALISLLTVSTVIFMLFLVNKNNIPTFPDTGVFIDGKVLGLKLAQLMGPGDEAFVNQIPADRPITFYMWYESNYGGSIVHKNDNSADRVGKSLFIVIPNDQLTLEMTSQPPIKVSQDIKILEKYPNKIKVFEFNGSVIYEVKR